MRADEITALFEGIMAQDNREEGVSIYADYSGRFMYGAYCFAVYTRERWQGDAVQEYMEEHGLPCGARDSMGLGSVIYWPNLTLGCLSADERALWNEYVAERYGNEDDDDDDALSEEE
jgi:hypothetical protein